MVDFWTMFWAIVSMLVIAQLVFIYQALRDDEPHMGYVFNIVLIAVGVTARLLS